MSDMAVREYKVTRERQLPSERGRSINLYVPVEEIDYADAIANERGISRSRAVSEIIAEHRQRAAKRNGRR
jgi:hypothetical protein